MQAIILAGGLGTRLRPLTDSIPKPMISVRGQPFLEHVIRRLAGQGVTDLILCVSYRWESIQQHFGDGRQWGVRLRYSVESTPLGTGGAIQQTAALLEGPFLVVNGDTYIAIDLPTFLRQATLGEASLGWLVTYQHPERNNLRVDGAGYVTAYRPGGHAEMTHADAGIGYYHPAVLRWLEPFREPFSWETVVFRRLIAQRLLCAYVTDTPFYDIGTPERLRTFEASGLPA